MPSKRPFKFTTQEIATVFWCIGLFVITIFFYMSYDPLYGVFIIQLQMLLFLLIGLFFMFLGFAFPCYQISKWNCNPYMDKLEQGWDIWLRTSKSRKYSAQCVQTGPLGQMKGLVSGHKADIINRGDFPVTLQNGNHAVIKYDLMSHNVNFNEAIGWRLISRKYGFIGVNAFRRCISDGKTVKKESWFEKRKKEKEAKKA
jgi:hypothetical protein